MNIKKILIIDDEPQGHDIQKIQHSLNGKVIISHKQIDVLDPAFLNEEANLVPAKLEAAIISAVKSYHDLILVDYDYGLGFYNGLDVINVIRTVRKKCDVILKGPTTTPRKGDNLPNIESANVAMRKELDLFANVRPIKNPKLNIDWIFYRENTEGGYAVGKDGININEDLSIDFTITTKQGSERIIRSAFEYAKNNNKTRVTAVTKANVIKTTDGKFLEIFYKIASEYKDIKADDWYIDIMTAKLIDEKRRSDFQVIVSPNLYGDILTDEAAEIQGGVGTAGSANIGNRYAMFEAIHGSAPRMVEEKREKYADPTSIIRASILLLEHIGYKEKANLIERALENCIEKGIKITGRNDGCTNDVFTDEIIKEIENMKK